MGNKRPRTPHFITGIGDGNVHDRAHENGGDDAYPISGGNPNINIKAKNIRSSNNNSNKNYQDRYGLRATWSASRNERLQRLEEPLLATDHWRDVFGSNMEDNMDPNGIGKPGAATIATGPWQVSAFAFLGMIVVVSAIFLHFVSESSAEHGTSSSSSSPYHYRRRQRQRRMHKIRKKKTDEWSDDEEPIQNGARLVPSDKSSSGGGGGISQSPEHAKQTQGQAQIFPYFYQQPSSNTRFASQDSRLRRTGNKEPYSPQDPPSGHQYPRKNSSGSHGNYYSMPPSAQQHHQAGGGNVPTYKSPAAPGNLLNLTPKVPKRGISPKNSYSSGGDSQYEGMSPPSSYRYQSAPLSARLRIPSTPDARDVFRVDPSLSNSANNYAGKTTSLLPTPPEESALLMPKQAQGTGTTKSLHARPLNSSNISSFASLEDHYYSRSVDEDLPAFALERRSSHHSSSSHGVADLVLEASSTKSQSSQNSHHNAMHSSVYSHQQSMLLVSPGNYEETPLIGNYRKIVDSDLLIGTPTLGDALLPPISTDEGKRGPIMPFIPSLTVGVNAGIVNGPKHRLSSDPPPRSILMDELRLVQMETGSSTHWAIEGQPDLLPNSELQHVNGSGEHEGDVVEIRVRTGNSGRKERSDLSEGSLQGGSDISIPSGDPRKGIIHKRPNLTMSTDSATSLQNCINFNELNLHEVIGGGGFGQVWRATWKGTPVAVKVLTGSAQNTHIAKAILEEFRAEINLLKGMRHPNICLYMGACVDPPNRAIITELAAHGSVWDALRLPLTAPYVVADGSPQGCWPLRLYMPDHHGAPPSSHGATSRVSAPIPPRGTWPWELVKRVSCGAARGMAYLHGGDPPVLHRDLKSANLLLDESYTTKVCDFGLSRLKAQTRSMTGNCGTVQWMAPEVLANRKYDEKADVYSYGIIVWELLSRECPYEGMTAIQCALAVLNRDKRPEIPKWCPPGLHALIKSCVKKEPSERPSFAQIIYALDAME